MNFCFWWSWFWWGASDELAFDDVITSRAFDFRCIKLPSCWFHYSHLFFQYTWTNISISNWQFLIPCYHQNSQEVMLNTFCSNRRSHHRQTHLHYNLNPINLQTPPFLHHPQIKHFNHHFYPEKSISQPHSSYTNMYMCHIQYFQFYHSFVKIKESTKLRPRKFKKPSSHKWSGIRYTFSQTLLPIDTIWGDHRRTWEKVVSHTIACVSIVLSRYLLVPRVSTIPYLAPFILLSCLLILPKQNCLRQFYLLC